MTWLAPAALVGLAAVLVPLLVHLLARRPASTFPFPTLQFLPPTSRHARARRRLADHALLLVRMATCAAAVVALAQPLVHWPSRDAARRARVVRAVVVDESASMTRGPANATPLDDAQRRAARATAGAFASTVISTPAMDDGIRRAVAWLSSAPMGRHEIVLVSDFQRGSIRAATLPFVPPHVGISLDAVTPGPPPLRAPGLPRTTAIDAVAAWVVPVLELTATETRVSYARVPADTRSGLGVAGVPTVVAVRLDEQSGQVERRASGGDAAGSAGVVAAACPGAVSVQAPEAMRGLALAALRAVAASGVPCARDAEHRVAVRFEAAAEAREAAPARPDVAAWMRAVLAALLRDPTVDASAIAGVAVQDGSMIVRVTVPPTSAPALALLRSVFVALSDATYERELEPYSEGPTWIAHLQRPSLDAPPAALMQEPHSDLRWFWGLALGMLALEQFLRRRRAKRPSQALADGMRAA